MSYSIRRAVARLSVVTMLLTSATAVSADPVLAEPQRGIIKTRVELAHVTKSPRYGSPAVFIGSIYAHIAQTQDGTGGAVEVVMGDVPVDLFARPVGSRAWKHVATRRTNDIWSGDSVFRFTHKPRRNTDYRIVYRGDLIHAPSSVTKRVYVQRYVSSVAFQAASGRYYLRGTVFPRVSGKIMRLQRAACPTWCSFSTVKSTRTSTKSTWSFEITPSPNRSVKWAYRAYAVKDRYFTNSYSHAWSFKRK